MKPIDIVKSGKGCMHCRVYLLHASPGEGTTTEWSSVQWSCKLDLSAVADERCLAEDWGECPYNINS